MKTRIQYVLLSATLSLVHAGCGGGEPEPSYADLVVVYNAEVEALDRLEEKRAEMVAEYEKQLRPGAEDALQAITGALNTVSEASRQNESELPSDPNEALDQAIKSAENAQQATAQLLEAAAAQAGAQQGGEVDLSAQYSEEFKLQLAALDKEIAEQKARVERAREARDAAEAK